MHKSFLSDEILLRALSEDIGTGDVTTNSVVPGESKIKGRFMAKENGIICGIYIAQRVFQLLDKDVVFNAMVADGENVNAGDFVAEVSGPARAILTGERVALNFMQRLSGIATKTASLTELVKGTDVRIVDTRKTTPGLRVFEKYAVKTGGGSNHRMNLSDGVLIKDNHIKAAGGIAHAVEAARSNAPRTLKIEVEVENLHQVQEALEAKADIIMLDNMDIDTMKEAVRLIDGKAITEASGNMDNKDLLAVAHTGVDLISIGALTHSVKALDISLKFL